MPIRTERLEEPSLNLTPMIDIVFLLIIFFMVGTRFAEKEQQYDIELPTASAVPPKTRLPDPIVINVARSGTLTVNGDRLDQAELRELLKTARENWQGQAVLIRGDGQGDYQHVIDVIDICTQEQIVGINLAFQPTEAGDR